MRALRLAATLACIVAFSDVASAAGITVTDAKVQAGKLIVTGKTPGVSQDVTLDGRFTVRSNASKIFAFAVPSYLPSDCVVNLKSGTATGVGVVANCGARGPAGPRGAQGPAGPPGPAGGSAGGFAIFAPSVQVTAAEKMIAPTIIDLGANQMLKGGVMFSARFSSGSAMLTYGLCWAGGGNDVFFHGQPIQLLMGTSAQNLYVLDALEGLPARGYFAGLCVGKNTSQTLTLSNVRGFIEAVDVKKR